MIATSIGRIEIKNLPLTAPFQVDFADYGDSIQLDISGIGVFKFFEPISDDLITEINTNINNSLSNYGDLTGHNAADIGYSITYSPKKKLNRSTNTGVVGVDISIFFKKPVPTASAYQLEPTITLISVLILEEIFYLPQNEYKD